MIGQFNASSVENIINQYYKSSQKPNDYEVLKNLLADPAKKLYTFTFEILSQWRINTIIVIVLFHLLGATYLPELLHHDETAI
jgi:hypothetical protein